MSQTINRSIKAEITEKLKHERRKIEIGSPNDYAEYRESVGKCKALEATLLFVTELINED